MFGFLWKGLDKVMKSNLDDAYKKIEELPEVYKVIVAELLNERYQKTVDLMGGGNKRVLDKHLHDEGVDAGNRLRYYESQLNEEEDWKLICYAAEAKLSEAIYHCLQCDTTPSIIEYGANTAEEFISTYIVKRMLYADEIDEIMGN